MVSLKEDKKPKIALVTGASRGIGKAIAIQLANDGFDIAFCYRKANAEAEEVKAKIEQLGCRVFAQECNVRDFDSVQAFIKAAKQHLGDITTVVNNAGIIKDKPLALMSQPDWQDVIETNLTSVFNICRSLVFDFIKHRQGCIINISSVAGIYGNIAQANYSASKGGMNSLSKTLAKELGTYGIRVNAVAPGFIQTDMTDKLDKAVLDRILPNISLQRIGTAQEVANLVSFLASDQASYITEIGRAHV